MAKILIADQDESFKQLATTWLKNEGHDVEITVKLREGLKLLDTFQPEVVILALSLPQTEPTEELIEKYIKSSFSPKVIITGNHLNSSDAAKFLNMGVFDCFEKPSKIKGVFIGEEKLQERLISTVSHAVSSVQRAISLGKDFKREHIIGDSPAIIACLTELERAVNSTRPILITGESGTGKELFARAAHENSPRFKKNIISLDCGAFSETTIKGHLFGHKKGSHSTADKDEDGLIKQADGGTLFLDEIGNLPPSIQNSLLRAIDEKEFYPLGADKPKKSDFRLVSATNADLKQKVKEGSFRNDLYNRINTFNIHLPPLRDRKQDIKALAKHFLDRISTECEVKPKKYTEDFLEALEMYEWESNIRELKNVIYQTVKYYPDIEILTADHLPSKIRNLWIASMRLKINEPSKEETSQLYEEILASLGNDTKQEAHHDFYYEMDYMEDIPTVFCPPTTETVQAEQQNMIEPSEEISPEKIITGEIKWDRIQKLLKDYPHKVSIMVAARSLWKGDLKEFAERLDVSKGAFYRFFSTAKKKARNEEFYYNDLKKFVPDKYHPALQEFFANASNRKKA